jgi:hypothetical protein
LSTKEEKKVSLFDRRFIMVNNTNGNGNVNVSEKTDRERLVIAKEVVIKALLPVVFDDVSEDKREQTFDDWYGKLLNLITGIEDDAEPVKVLNALPVETPGASKKAQKAEVHSDSPVENKATDKQIKKIFAMGHTLNMGKEELEEEAFKVTGIDSLSELSKSQASDLIDDLAQIGINDIYG